MDMVTRFVGQEPEPDDKLTEELANELCEEALKLSGFADNRDDFAAIVMDPTGRKIDKFSSMKDDPKELCEATYAQSIKALYEEEKHRPYNPHYITVPYELVL